MTDFLPIELETQPFDSPAVSREVARTKAPYCTIERFRASRFGQSPGKRAIAVWLRTRRAPVPRSSDAAPRLTLP